MVKMGLTKKWACPHNKPFNKFVENKYICPICKLIIKIEVKNENSNIL
jgi:hypothetical protein